MLFMLTITQVPPAAFDGVMALQHLVDFARDVAGVHHLAARPRAACWLITCHHSVEALFERAMRSVGLQFIVFDEIDAAVRQRVHQLRRSLRAKGRHWV